jgi:hypothetical protein
MARPLTLPERLGLPAQGLRFRLEAVDETGAELRVARLEDGEPVGRATIEVDGPALSITSVCIDETLRGYGAASEAARLLIGAATSGGFAVVRAFAPAGRGLAVYFWFRMGLHPLHGEGPEGGIWLERRVG